MGLNEGGQRANYAGNLSSRGLGVLGLSRQWGPRTTTQVWNYYADNLFNATSAELTTSPAMGAGLLSLRAQYHYQRTVGTDGNADPRLAYRLPRPPGPRPERPPGLSARPLERERQLYPPHPQRALPVYARMGPRAVLYLPAPRAY